MNIQSSINRLLTTTAAISGVKEAVSPKTETPKATSEAKPTRNLYDLIPSGASPYDKSSNPFYTPSGYDPRELARRRLEVFGKRKYSQLVEYYSRRNDNGE